MAMKKKSVAERWKQATRKNETWRQNSTYHQTLMWRYSQLLAASISYALFHSFIVQVTFTHNVITYKYESLGKDAQNETARERESWGVIFRFV